MKEKEALNVPNHQLITDVQTRWNSTYLMFETFFEQRVIHATFLDKRMESNMKETHTLCFHHLLFINIHF